jgi:hypothetical protein
MKCVASRFHLSSWSKDYWRNRDRPHTLLNSIPTWATDLPEVPYPTLLTAGTSTKVHLPSQSTIPTTMGWEGGKFPKFNREDIGMTTGGRPPTSTSHWWAEVVGCQSVTITHQPSCLSPLPAYEQLQVSLLMCGIHSHCSSQKTVTTFLNSWTTNSKHTFLSDALLQDYKLQND